MGELIRFEFEKILRKKYVWIPLVLMMALAAVLASNYFFGQISTADGRELSGRAANEYIMETGRRYEGPLTDEKVQEILEKEGPIANSSPGEYVYVYGEPLWNWTYTTFQDEYSKYYGMTVKEAYTDQGIQVNAGFFYSWETFFDSLSNFMMLFGALIVIAVAGIFSDEYGSGMDALVLTSRYGKNRCIKAKIIAAFLFTVGCCALVFLIHLIPLLMNFGLEGIHTSVQLILDVPYNLTCGGAVLWEMVIWTLAMLVTTGAVLIISVYTQSSFVSLICGFVFYFGPICIIMMGLPQKILGLFPIFATMQEMLCIPQFHLLGTRFAYQWIYLVEFAVVAAAAFVLCCKGFAKHQVK